MTNKLIILDMDGTIIKSATGQMIAQGIADQQLMPGVAEKCAWLIKQGHTLAVASNQGGVALGYLTLVEAHNNVGHAARSIGAKFYRLSPYHPKGTNEFQGDNHPDRKPNPGMLLSLMTQAQATLENVVFVGDMDSDMKAAEAAGIKFEWADAFFGDWLEFNIQIIDKD